MSRIPWDATLKSSWQKPAIRYVKICVPEKTKGAWLWTTDEHMWPDLQKGVLYVQL